MTQPAQMIQLAHVTQLHDLTHLAQVQTGLNNVNPSDSNDQTVSNPHKSPTDSNDTIGSSDPTASIDPLGSSDQPGANNPSDSNEETISNGPTGSMTQLAQICQEVIQSQYVLGVRRTQLYGTSLEFKLNGDPWSYGMHTDGHDGIHGRNLICHLIAALASRHWRPVISADVSAKIINRNNRENYRKDVDSIFFTYDPTSVQATASAP
ncbi:hypothetical protein ACROYT_G033698 [Oculina patagonica]